MAKIYYTPITYQSNLRKDNWKHGGNASTFMSDDFSLERPLKMEVNQYGRTKDEAREKLLKFLSSNGQTEIECVEIINQPADKP